MSYKNRKAVARSFLILMLIAILSLTIIIYAVNQFFTRADQVVDEQACRASILTRVKSNLGIYVLGKRVGELSPFPIVCKTQHKVLEGDKEQVMIQISDLSARCWWMFLNGEYGNIFDKLQLTSDQKCFICYTFSIADKDININEEELREYMDDHYYITKAGEKGEPEGVVTYLDYIQRWKGKGVITTSEGIEFVGEKEEVYTINFLSPDLTLWGDWLSSLIININVFKSDDERIGETELKEMNMIYIEQMGANDELKKSCKVLKSI